MRSTMMLLFAACLAVALPASAQEAKPAPAKTDKSATEVPNGSPKELLEFMESSLTLNPKDDSPEAIQEAFTQTVKKIIAAAEKLLAHPEATDEQKSTAQQFRIDLLYQGAQAELPGMMKQLQDLAATLLKNDPKSDSAALANFRCIMAMHEDEIGLDPLALPKVEQFIEHFPKEVAAVSLLEGVIQSAEWAVNPEAGKKACQLILKHFPEESKEMNIEGVQRRIESVGKPFVLAGTTASGKPFDLKQLHGKVVLVDFWATWCGPCLAEMPHLQEAYEKYREKGFEIVGVSLDEDKESLDEFLKENKLPWMQLYESDASKRGFENANVKRYGINAIPAMFLLDQSGRVVSTTVRGPFLEALLEDLLSQPKTDPSK